jgi:hypothetical protein
MSTHDVSTEDAVIAELTAAYGLRFLRGFDGVEPELMRRAWRRQLMTLSPQHIAWALHHLPEQPPNAVQFRSLALQRPMRQQQLPELPAPPADPERVRQLMQPARDAPTRGPRQWAIDLKARELAGEHLTLAQREMWRACPLRERADALEPACSLDAATMPATAYCTDPCSEGQ